MTLKNPYLIMEQELKSHENSFNFLEELKKESQWTAL